MWRRVLQCSPIVAHVLAVAAGQSMFLTRTASSKPFFRNVTPVNVAVEPTRWPLLKEYSLPELVRFRATPEGSSWCQSCLREQCQSEVPQVFAGNRPRHVHSGLRWPSIRHSSEAGPKPLKGGRDSANTRQSLGLFPGMHLLLKAWGQADVFTNDSFVGFWHGVGHAPQKI